MFRKISIFQLIITILFIVIGFVYFKINNNNIKARSNDLIIDGTIQSIEFDEKGYLNLIIKGTVYYFPITNGKGKFEIGDSIVKEKNSEETTQYRNGKVIQRYYVDVVK